MIEPENKKLVSDLKRHHSSQQVAQYKQNSVRAVKEQAETEDKQENDDPQC